MYVYLREEHRLDVPLCLQSRSKNLGEHHGDQLEIKRNDVHSVSAISASVANWLMQLIRGEVLGKLDAWIYGMHSLLAQWHQLRSTYLQSRRTDSLSFKSVIYMMNEAFSLRLPVSEDSKEIILGSLNHLRIRQEKIMDLTTLLVLVEYTVCRYLDRLSGCIKQFQFYYPRKIDF